MALFRSDKELRAMIESVARNVDALSKPPVVMSGSSPNQYSMHDPMYLLLTRLRMQDYERLPFDHVSAHLDDKSAFVFIVKNGQAITLDDDVNLYPSDGLVTQIRLLLADVPKPEVQKAAGAIGLGRQIMQSHGVDAARFTASYAADATQE